MITKTYVTQLSYDIIGCAIEVHRALGPGLLESVYEKCLKHELELKGFKVEQQVSVDLAYKKINLQALLRIDLLVENLVIIEVKAVKILNPIFDAQTITYMKLLKVPQGLLINFFTKNITKSCKPFINEYFDELPD